MEDKIYCAKDQREEVSLKEKYKEYFAIGAAVNPYSIKKHEKLLQKHFNSITAENEMKFVSVHPEENKYTFEKADLLVDFKKANNMKMRGHTLVWHGQVPDWLFTDSEGNPASRDLLLGRMKDHISTVMGRYKNEIYCWDVVNEAVQDSGNEVYRKSKWFNIIGEDFIEQAFRFANSVDPGAKLFYNDYNAVIPEKRDKIYSLLKGLKEKDVPVHGMGIQGHWNIYSPTVQEIREAIEKYASLGLEIQITELDMSVYAWNDKGKLEEPSTELLELQAKRYDKIFSLFREYKDVITGVTFWGVADDYTWLDDFPVKGRKNWPLLFDVNHEPKPAFYKIVDF